MLVAFLKKETKLFVTFLNWNKFPMPIEKYLQYYTLSQRREQNIINKSFTFFELSLYWYLFVLLLKIYLLLYISTLYLFSDIPEEGIRSHYRWLWATMWLLGIELRTSGRAVSALNHWAISPAHSCYYKLPTGAAGSQWSYEVYLPHDAGGTGERKMKFQDL